MNEQQYIQNYLHKKYVFTIHVLSTIAIFKRVAIEKITVPRGPELQYFPINICKLTAAIEKEQLVPDNWFQG